MQVDLVVLGSGPGGYSAAFRAADLGLNVALVERDSTLGGVCLNVGCIPSKALLHAAKVISEAREMGSHGVTFGDPQIDLEKLIGWKGKVVGQLTAGLDALAKQRKVEVVNGYGTFAGPNQLRVNSASGQTEIEFKHAIVAAGSEPVELPGFPNDDPRLIDSTGALALTRVPERMLVIGGGIIGLEMATVYMELGSQVTVVELLDGAHGRRGSRSREAARTTHEEAARGDPHRDAGHVRRRAAGRARGTLSKVRVRRRASRFDTVLVAVGRTPNGGRIGLDAAGVNVDERGFVPVDRQQRTNVSHIFAIGDIVGQPMLAHKAVHEGKIAAEVIAGHKVANDALVIPSVAYTDPEVAWVGLTENGSGRAGDRGRERCVPLGGERTLAHARSQRGHDEAARRCERRPRARLRDRRSECGRSRR